MTLGVPGDTVLQTAGCDVMLHLSVNDVHDTYYFFPMYINFFIMKLTILCLVQCPSDLLGIPDIQPKTKRMNK